MRHQTYGLEVERLEKELRFSIEEDAYGAYHWFLEEDDYDVEFSLDEEYIPTKIYGTIQRGTSEVRYSALIDNLTYNRNNNAWIASYWVMEV